jgi:hypothetical protein
MNKKNFLKELLRKQAMVLAYSYEQKVNCLIREKYSIDAEFAILRQRDTKPEEFAEYNAYCESCKELVKNGGFLNGR